MVAYRAKSRRALWLSQPFDCKAAVSCAFTIYHLAFETKALFFEILSFLEANLTFDKKRDNGTKAFYSVKYENVSRSL